MANEVESCGKLGLRLNLCGKLCHLLVHAHEDGIKEAIANLHIEHKDAGKVLLDPLCSI